MASHSSSLLPSDSAIQALRDSEELNLRILEAVPGGVVHVDAEGRVVRANQAALEILGLRYDELTRRYVQDFEGITLREDGSPCPADEYPVVMALRTGRSQPPMTIGVQSPGGKVRWAVFRAVPLLEDGIVTGAVVTFIDITVRREAEEALRASEERWRSLAQSIPDFAVIVDRDGVIQSINRYERPYTPEDVVGHTVYEFTAQTHVAGYRERIESVFNRGQATKFELRVLSEDGREAWYETRIAPVHRDGQVVAALIVARDISADLALQRQLARSERLASVGLLAAGIAHEINNPLAYVLANLDFVLRHDHALEGESREALKEAREGAERVRRIVHDLKTFARHDDERDAPVDVREVLASALGIAQNEIRHRAQLTLDIHSVPHVVANEARLGQVLLNLLMNAAQAIDEGRAASNAVHIEVRETDDGDGVLVSIRDSGVGIPEEDLARIFDPFYTTKPVGVGTGLGLSICHNLIVDMGGRIDVESRVGRGSTFTVVLPVSEEAAVGSKSGAESARSEQSLPRYEILVIDDDPPVARAVQRLLSTDHGVTTASRGEEALRLLETRRFDAILCDLMMPDVSGAELHRRTLARDPELARRFIFITGGPFSVEARNLVEATTNYCLTKPFGASELIEAIRMVVTGE
jgi:two-component system, cell cycle sensor histidine kinase and response regulator CckA